MDAEVSLLAFTLCDKSHASERRVYTHEIYIRSLIQHESNQHSVFPKRNSTKCVDRYHTKYDF